MRLARILSALLTTVLVFITLTTLASAGPSGPELKLSGTYIVTTKGHDKLKVTWTDNGVPQTGEVFLQKTVKGKWKTYRSYKINKGKGTVNIRPNGDTKYRVKTGNTVSNSKSVVTSSNYIKVAKTKTTIKKGQRGSLSVKYVRDAKLVPSDKIILQHKVGSKWKHGRTVAIKNGKGKASLRPAASKSYRLVSENNKIISPIVKATVVATAPSSFTIYGSGYGHGVGMSQYGAYQMGREGKSTTQILKHYYHGVKVQRPKTPENIRVKVFGTSGDASNVTFKIDQGTWRLRSSSGKTLTSGGAGTTVRLSTKSGKLVIVANKKTYKASKVRLHWSGTRYYKSDSAKAVVSLLKDNGSNAANGTYRNGRFTVQALDGKVSIINDVLLNTEYLYGLAEMPSSWSTAALKSQVIAGRTYALLTMDPSPSSTYDVLDSTVHQNYTGWNKENEGPNGRWGKKWKQVVDSTVSSRTKAQVMTDGKSLKRAYYFSSSGGRTANSEDVWGSKLAWTRSVKDPYSLNAPGNSMSSWSRTLTQSRARTIFGLKDVASIKVTSKYSSGQAKTLTATSTKGKTATYTAKADPVRTTFALPSSWIKSIS